MSECLNKVRDISFRFSRCTKNVISDFSRDVVLMSLRKRHNNGFYLLAGGKHDVISLNLNVIVK